MYLDANGVNLNKIFDLLLFKIVLPNWQQSIFMILLLKSSLSVVSALDAQIWLKLNGIMNVQ